MRICSLRNASIILAGLLLSLVLNAGASAQTKPELGVRFGDNVSIDGTLPIKHAPRLHAAVYLERFGVGAYGNWVFRLSSGPPNLRFYLGAGPEMFFEDRFDLAFAADVGVEWAFDQAPFTVGFDWRPSVRLTNGVDSHTGNWGFTARFRFGNGLFEPAD